MNRLLVFAVVGLGLLGIVCVAEAQKYRYMDASGNIRFVESLNDVPRQYRQQIVPPTPTPVLDIRQKKEQQRAKERELREQQRQVQLKKKELERTRRELERDQRLNAEKLGSGSRAAGPSQKEAVREDRIEVIQ